VRAGRHRKTDQAAVLGLRRRDRCTVSLLGEEHFKPRAAGAKLGQRLLDVGTLLLERMSVAKPTTRKQSARASPALGASRMSALPASFATRAGSATVTSACAPPRASHVRSQPRRTAVSHGPLVGGG
jgi:hypothetical protein